MYVWYVCVCEYVFVCVCVWVSMCGCGCVGVCVWVWVCLCLYLWLCVNSECVCVSVWVCILHTLILDSNRPNEFIITKITWFLSRNVNIFLHLFVNVPQYSPFYLLNPIFLLQYYCTVLRFQFQSLLCFAPCQTVNKRKCVISLQNVVTIIKLSKFGGWWLFSFCFDELCAI